jgi:hypothetical protein
MVIISAAILTMLMITVLCDGDFGDHNIVGTNNCSSNGICYSVNCLDVKIRLMLVVVMPVGWRDDSDDMVIERRS